MSYNSETDSSNEDFECLDTEEKLRRELEEQREELIILKKENERLKKLEYEQLRQEHEEQKKKLEMIEEQNSKLALENERLKENDKDGENMAELTRLLETERQRVLTQEEEIAQLRDEMETLKKKNLEEAKDETEMTKDSETTITEPSEVFNMAREKPWMIIALHNLKAENAEIVGKTAKLFKSFAQHEAVMKRKALPCNIGKTMKKLCTLEKQIKDYMNTITKRNNKQLNSASEITAKTLRYLIPAADMDDRQNLVELSNEVIELADKLVGFRRLNPVTPIPVNFKESYEKGVMPTHRQIEKVDDNGFYKETLKYKDGGKIVCKWRPDSVLRDGIRVVVEENELIVYCISGVIQRRYSGKTGNIFIPA